MKTTTCKTILLAALVALTAVAPALAVETVDWPQWRGPNQDLRSGADIFGDTFSLEVAWKRTLGSGYSSISVVGDRALTMYSDGENDVLVALDASSGEELWSYPIASTYKGHSGSDDGPLGTPTIHEGTVYVLGPKGHLAAVGLEDGKEIWKHKIDEAFEAVAPEYGFATVPVMADDHLIVQTGGANGRCVSAFDPKTGEIEWSKGNDPVGYHSPLVVEFFGRRQLLAISNQHLIGIDPSNGEEIWKHRYTDEEDWWAQPVVLGSDRVLLAFRDDAALYQVTESEGGYSLQELWRNRNLRNTDVVPIFHQGYLYGFAGRFLAAVNAETGEVAWKSRPPGMGGMVLVDDHLVVFGAEGEVVVAEANPQEYVERARLKVAERFSYTPPSFAGGRLFVRDLEQIASIRVSDTAAPPAVAESLPLQGELGDFVRRLQSAPDKQAMIDRFLAGQKSFPIIEGDELVHFVYRGDIEDLAISGNFLPQDGEDTLYRVEGTDFFFRSYRLTPKAHFEYSFHSFDERMTDPLNPRTLVAEGEPPSVFAMPGWQEPEHLREPTGARGRLDTFNWESGILENEREITVWLPPDYDQSQDRYPLAVVNYGNLALSQGLMARSLDNLVGASVAPVVVAFLPRVDFDEYAQDVEHWVKALAEELFPTLEEKYRLLPGAENRAMTGIASGAFGSTYAAFARPGLIGKVATQSFYFREEALEKWRRALAADSERSVELYVEWSTNDIEAPTESGIHCERDSKALAEELRGKGYKVTTHESVDGAGWGSWRARTDRIFEMFFPLGR